MKKILFRTFVLFALTIQAQSIKVGAWRDHLSYYETYDICTQGNLIYTSTDKALFVYDKEDQSIERINTLNRLSDVNVSAIACTENQLIVGYENGNIDLLRGAKTCSFGYD